MKKIRMILLLVFLCFFSLTLAVESENVASNNSGDKETMKVEQISGEQLSKEKNDNSKIVSEEGAMVDTNHMSNDYQVEMPTIVLLSLFAILIVIALVLIIFKI